MSIITRIKIWLVSGGGQCLGIDEHGERMYSLTNGERLAIFSITFAMFIIYISGGCALAWWGGQR